MTQKRTQHRKNIEHPDYPHGLMAGYGSGCRCDLCKITKATHRKLLAGKRDFTAMDFPHGKSAGSSAGCKCELCVQAKRDYEIARLQKKDPSYVPNRRKHGGNVDSPYFTHGLGGYRYGCKCDVCKDAHNSSNRKLKVAYRATNHNGINDKKRVYDRAKYQTAEGRARVLSANAKRKELTAAIEEYSCATIELLRLVYLHCPKGYHVDHIISLSNGGKHHPDNLQYLPAVINIKKHNNDDFDCSAYSIRWQDFLSKPSTTIPQGSTHKRVEAPNIPKMDEDIVLTLQKCKAVL